MKLAIGITTIAIAGPDVVVGKQMAVRGAATGRHLAVDPPLDSYAFLVSGISDTDDWCITATEGSDKSKGIGFRPCDYAGAPSNQLWHLDAEGKVHLKANPKRCMIVDFGKHLETARRVRLADCDESTDLNKFVHNKSIDSLRVAQDERFCVVNQGVNPNLSDKMQVLPCTTEGRFIFAYIREISIGDTTTTAVPPDTTTSTSLSDTTPTKADTRTTAVPPDTTTSTSTSDTTTTKADTTTTTFPPDTTTSTSTSDTTTTKADSTTTAVPPDTTTSTTSTSDTTTTKADSTTTAVPPVTTPLTSTSDTTTKADSTTTTSPADPTAMSIGVDCQCTKTGDMVTPVAPAMGEGSTSKDGKYLVEESSNFIRVVRQTDGETVFSTSYIGYTVYGFGPRSRYFTLVIYESVLSPATLQVWDLENNERMFNFQYIRESAGFGYSPDGRTFLMGSENSGLLTVNLVNLDAQQTNMLQYVLPFWNTYIFSPCGDAVAVAIAPESTGNTNIKMYRTLDLEEIPGPYVTMEGNWEGMQTTSSFHETKVSPPLQVRPNSAGNTCP